MKNDSSHPDTKRPGVPEVALYKSPDADIHQRVEDLLSRMSVAEKAAQMMGMWNERNETLLDEKGNFDEEKARRSFSHGNGIGQIGRPNEVPTGKGAREIAVLTNRIQKFFIEESRLGIPVIFHEECLHGLAAPIFPLSQGSSPKVSSTRPQRGSLATSTTGPRVWWPPRRRVSRATTV